MKDRVEGSLYKIVYYSSEIVFVKGTNGFCKGWKEYLFVVKIVVTRSGNGIY